MAENKLISVHICNGPAGQLINHYGEVRTGGRRATRYVLAEPGIQICPRIHIPANFDWRGANGLLIELFYNAWTPLTSLPIPRKSDNTQDITLDIDEWPVWNKKIRKWQDAKFAFRERKRRKVLNPYIIMRLSF